MKDITVNIIVIKKIKGKPYFCVAIQIQKDLGLRKTNIDYKDD